MSKGRYRPTTFQVKKWAGSFGNDYVDRNEYSDEKMRQGTEAFRQMLGGLKIRSVLEVGSNIGLNLHFIHTIFGGRAKLYAVEPNRKAFDKLLSQRRIKIERAWNCDVFRLPVTDSSIDLVFTSGVLIHIASDDLGRATDEIVRIARRYVLCIEYFSHTPTEIPYRGQTGLLFKRDFGDFYMNRFPHLKWVRYGFLWQREFPIFDNLNWWLFEKEQKQSSKG
jgi:pseudaminic acid biosynthesis-associated methylase